MIFTVGHARNYLKAIHESDDGFIIKLGKLDDYSGGIVFETYEDAEDYLARNNERDWAVFPIDADWDKDTEFREDYYNYLIRDAQILIVEKRGCEEQ